MYSKDTNVDLTEKHKKLISPIYSNNGVSSVLVVPKKLAIKYKMNKPCNVIIEDTGTGIYFKKLEL